MRRLHIVSALAIAWVLFYGMTTPGIAAEGDPAAADGPALNRVVLFKGGVGYFELRGRVPSGEGVPLAFKQDQMNDLLKSMTVLNLTGGGIGSVVYDSQKTAAQELRDYTFEFKKGDGLPQILEQLQGSPVELNAGNSVFKGTVMGVERRMTQNGEEQAPFFYLNILDSGGRLRSFQTDEITGVRFLDRKLNEEMEKYLKMRFRSLRRDEKTVVITPTGKGVQEISVGYVVEQPVWKATYRIVLSETNQRARPFLQGWAIIDNVSGADWKDVDLRLVSGLPVSFVKNLYDPQYTRRPVIPTETEASAVPSMPETGVKTDRMLMAPAAMSLGQMRPMKAAGPGEGMEAAPREPIFLPEQMRKLEANVATREVGEMFEYRIDHPVTILRNQSALVPIVAKETEAEAVDLYNETVRPGNPLAAVRLKNTTGLTLEGGTVTVLQDDTYAGEALTPTLKPNEQRYITYAVDLGLHVHTRAGTQTEEVNRVVINRGVLRMHHAVIETKTYTLDNKNPNIKTVVIDHPYHPDWKLLNSEKPIETTDNYLRFEVKAAALKVTAFTVQEMRDSWESISVGNLTPDQVVLFAGRKYLDPKTHEQLEKIVGLKSDINAADRDLKAIEKEREQMFKDQKRLRDNLQGLGQSTEEKELRSRYILQLNQQETDLEKGRGRERALQGQLEAMQKEMNDLIAALDQDMEITK